LAWSRLDDLLIVARQQALDGTFYCSVRHHHDLIRYRYVDYALTVSRSWSAPDCVAAMMSASTMEVSPVSSWQLSCHQRCAENIPPEKPPNIYVSTTYC